MRALANFIMQGRVQASVVALIGSWFPLISPAAVALVTLRRGANDGSLILAVAILPVLLALYMSEVGPLMPAITLLSLLIVFAAAELLRRFVSWPAVLTGMVALGAGASLMLGQFLPDSVAELSAAMGDLFKEIQAQGAAEQVLPTLGTAFALGLIAHVLMLSSLASLLLARWWQASLYNPGGFQREFHQLQLGRRGVFVCLAAAVYCSSQGDDYAIWTVLFGFPLLLVGIAIVHSLIKQRQMGRQWLVMMYIALIFVGPLVLALTVLAVLDSWFDFRGRLSQG